MTTLINVADKLPITEPNIHKIKCKRNYNKKS